VLAQDPDNNTLSYSFTSSVPSGMTINGSTGVISWPAPSTFGTPITVQVSDGQGGTATQTFSITFSGQPPANQLPVITSSPPLTATVGQVYIYNAAGTDPDGDPITWKLLQAPAGMSVSADRGTIRWTPAASQDGNQAVTLEVLDAQGGAATQTWTIRAQGFDVPPLLTSTPLTQTQAAQLYYYAIQAADANADTLTYTVSGFPASVTVYPSGLWTGTPMSS